MSKRYRDHSQTQPVFTCGSVKLVFPQKRHQLSHHILRLLFSEGIERRGFRGLNQMAGER